MNPPKPDSEKERQRSTKVHAWLVEKSPQIRTYGYLKDLFRPFPDLILHYDWLLSDIDCNFFPISLARGEDTILTGSELSSLATDEEQPQFMWGVFSSLSPGEGVDLSKNMIFADGNADLWNVDVRIQHSGSAIEIISFDSSLFIFLTTDASIGERIRNAYPEGKDLVEWNRGAEDRRKTRAK